MTSQKKSKLNSKRLLRAILLIAVQAAVILFIIVFLWNKLWYQEQLALFLPAENTLGFVEINIDPNSPQQTKLQNLLQTQIPDFNLEQVLIDNVPHYDELNTWIGNRTGFALINQSGRLDQALFLQYKDQKAANLYLNSILLDSQADQIIEEKYHGHRLLSFQIGQRFHTTFLSGYLVFADQIETLKTIVDVKIGSSENLKSSQKYQQVTGALPGRNLAWVYIDSSNTIDFFLDNHSLLSSRLPVIAELMPFLNVFSAEAFAVFIEQNQQSDSINIIQVTQLNTAAPNAAIMDFPEQYHSRLMDLIPDTALIKVGGRDLAHEYKQISELYLENSAIKQTILTGIFKQKIEEIVGTEIDFEQEILPLVTKEYLFALQGTLEEPQYILVIELQSDAKKQIPPLIEKLKQKFAEAYPVERTITLPDETEGKELIADSENISDTVIDSSGGRYNLLQIGDNSDAPEIAYAVTDQYFAITNDQATLELLLSGLNLLDSDYQPSTLIKRLPHLDEYAKINPSQLLPPTGQTELDLILENLTKLEYGRDYQGDKIISHFIATF